MTGPPVRTRVPVDERAPIACRPGPAGLSGRIDEVGRLRDRLRSIERTPGGLVVRFEPGTERQDVERFVREEKGCCAFWGFEVAEEPDLTLRWDGPSAAQPLLDELHRFLAGAPLPPPPPPPRA